MFKLILPVNFPPYSYTLTPIYRNENPKENIKP